MNLARLALAVILFLACASPVQADGPGPYKVHLPIISAGCDMTSTSLATLEISDGDVTVDLLRGNIHLKDWNPAVPQLKGGGIWQDSALATGRRMVDRRFGNVSDSLSLIISSPEQDDTIREIGDLLHLLEKARDFTASSWQSDPVWIKRQAGCETNPTYALIYDYKIPQLSNPYAAPFAAATQLATMNNFTLSMEHSIWLSCRPGAGECVQVSGMQTGWSYAGWTAAGDGMAGIPWPGIVTDGAGCAGITTMLWGDTLGDIHFTTDGVVWNGAAAAPGSAVRTIIEASDGFLYAATDAGVYRSNDCGDNWVLRGGPASDNVGLKNLIEATDGYLYVVDSSGRVQRSNDGGVNWVLVFNSDVNHAIFQASDGYIYIASNNGAIWRSSNGTTWAKVAQFLGYNNPHMFFEYGGYIYASFYIGAPGSGGGLIRSSDGVSWGLSSSGFDNAPYDYTYLNGVHYITDAGTGPATDSHVWKSTDLISWQIEVTIASNGMSGIVVLGNTLYVATNVGGGEIYKSGSTVDVGRAATCADEVYLANKQNIAQLTRVLVYDAAPITWTSRFPATFPYNLYPAVPANGDILYIGAEDLVNGGPFESAVFDIGVPYVGTSWTITWEYSDGAAGWPALTVQDGTQSFMATGVNSVHWSPPAGWRTDVVNGITAYWVRARITAIAGSVSSPTQANRDLYTVTWPYADIVAAQVGGDIPALAQVKLHNRSDKDGRAGSGLDLWDNRVIVGGRSYDRGPTFTAYLNASDEQNPAGVTVTLGANTTVPPGISGITGKLCTWAAALADTTFVDRVTFTLGPTIARDFYGTFHAFLRASVTAGSSGDIHARLQVRTGSGGVTLTSVDDYLKGTTDYEVLDFGRVSIPASGLLSFDDLGDSTVLAVQFRNDSGAARTVYVHDLILIPVDECAVDATDYANITLSVVGRTSSTPHLLDFDSLTYHKIDIRTLVRTADGNGFVTSVYVPGGGPMLLQANARQRLWAFAMQTSATGTTYVWLSPPWIAHSVQVLANERWLGLRGDR